MFGEEWTRQNNVICLYNPYSCFDDKKTKPKITNHKCYVILYSKFIDAKEKVAQMNNDIQEQELYSVYTPSRKDN